MAEEIERIYTVPLRNAHLAPLTKRARRAVNEVRHFLARHMKAEEAKIWIDNPVNEMIWARGIQKPPRRIRVRAIKFEDGVVEVSLPESVSARRQAVEDEQHKADEKAKEAAEKAKEATAAETPAAETPAPASTAGATDTTA